MKKNPVIRTMMLALCCGVMLLLPRQSLAQQSPSTVKGIVHSDANLPLAGVSVVIRNGQTNFTTGAKTDSSGLFTATVPAGGPYRFSFSSVGYENQDMAGYNLKEATTFTLDVSLKPTAGNLEQVVVIGYGTRKKSDLTGSISQVKAADINATATSNIANALQGRAAGVAITTSNVPGSSPTIRIRGSNSITAGNNPLLVVDGLPLENTNLNDINSDDIATLDILKDASSTAVYGSRGANGVIMITTKKGSAGRNNVEFSTYYGSQSPARLVNLISGQQFIDFINTAYTYVNNKPVYGTGGYLATPPVTNTNWQKELMRSSAPLQNYNLSFSGGNQKTKYLLSAGTFSQDGLLQASGFKRYTVRTNLEQNVTNWFTVGTHIQVNRSERNANNPSLQDIFRYGFPTMPVRNADGSFYYATEADNGVLAPFTDNTRWNPVADAGLVTDRTIVNRGLGDLYAEVKFLKHFSLRSNIGGDISDTKRYYYAPSNSTPGYKQKGVGSTTTATENQYVTESVLTYSNAWDKHRLTANAVYSYQSHGAETNTMSGSGFPTDFTGYYNVGLASINNTPSSDRYANALMSYTARASYAYADKYLLTMTGRYDGSSRFGANNKWGFFPSMGAGWNLNKEKFMEQLGDKISLLKLRGSVGVTGNQDIGNYKSIALQGSDFYIQGGNNLLLGITEGLGNPDLKWERTLQVDVGMDASFWKDFLSLSVDYYKKNTKDLLYQVPIPTTSGFRSIIQNIGEVENKGVEVSASANVIRSKSFRWTVGGNISWNRNRITSLYGGVSKVQIADYQYLVVGDPLNSYYANRFVSIIQTPEQLADAKKEQPNNTLLALGSEKYADINGDGLITSSDYVNIGTADPKMIYGFSTNFSYKGIGLEVLGQGATGMAVPPITYNIVGEYQMLNRIYIPSQYAYDRMWSPTNTTGTFPRAGARNVNPSDRSNGHLNYFIVRNIRLSYQVKASWLRKLSVQNLGLYANAQNLLSYSGIRGYNPENGDVAYPFARTILVGANLNF